MYFWNQLNRKKKFNGKNRTFSNNKKHGGGNQECNLCREKGHLSWACPYADQFAKILPKIKKQKKPKTQSHHLKQ